MAEEKDKHPGVEPQPPELVEMKVRVEPPESYVYSNLSGTSLSPFDIRLHFAEVLPSAADAAGEQAKVRTVAGIIMPPEHAAALAMLLMQQVQNYERQFGPIRHREWRAATERAAKFNQGHSEDGGTTGDADSD